MDRYILCGHRPVPAGDLIGWARWVETADRRVAFTRIPGSEISTVFLGLDHRFGSHEAPALFESMIFGGPLEQDQDRYATWEEAEAGHRKMVRRAWLALLKPRGLLHLLRTLRRRFA